MGMFKIGDIYMVFNDYELAGDETYFVSFFALCPCIFF